MLEDQLAEAMLDGKVSKGDTVQVTVGKNADGEAVLQFALENEVCETL